MKIRIAMPDELPVITEIHRTAFTASSLGHHGEAELAEALYADGDVVASLVAVAENIAVGHILFSRMTVDADGEPLRAAGLAPVSVLPLFQRSGVGAALIRAALQTLRADGFQISFVVGHPDYYANFGYRAHLARPYECSYTGPHFMALHLDSAVALPQRGKVEYAPAFARMG